MKVLFYINLFRGILPTHLMLNVVIMDCTNDTNNIVAKLGGCNGQVKSSTKQSWCLDEDYQINQAPSEDVTAVYYTIVDKKVLDVDEKDKEIRLYLKGKLMWEDARIKTAFTSVDRKYGRMKVQFDIVMPMLWWPNFNIPNLLKINSAYGEKLKTLATSLEFLTNNPFLVMFQIN